MSMKFLGGGYNLTAVCTQTTFKAPNPRSFLENFSGTVSLVERLGLSWESRAPEKPSRVGLKKFIWRREIKAMLKWHGA